MGKIKYVVSRIRKMDFDSMGELAQTVSDRSGKPKPLVILDMVWCGLRYQAGYTDYELCALERTNAAQRKTYVTRGVNDRLVAQFNVPEYRHIFSNKDEFNAVFSDYLARGWMRIAPAGEPGFDLSAAAQALREFCSGKTEVVAKLRDGMCGNGVEMLRPAQYPDPEKFYTDLQSRGVGVLEDVIVQHPDMSALYPDSINTLRLVTLNNGKTVTLVLALCRVGNGSRVDNFLHGGMATRIDMQTGRMQYDCVDEKNRVYDKHPVTGVRFVGYQIPMWAQCVEMAKKAALEVPQIGYVGWDIAVTPDGPALVEGNEFPGHCMYQLPPHTPDGYGVLPLFETAIHAK